MLSLNHISQEEYNKAVLEVDEGLHFKNGIIDAESDGVYSYHADALISEVVDDIAKRKGLRYREDILDNMGSEELVDNLFRIVSPHAFKYDFLKKISALSSLHIISSVLKIPFSPNDESSIITAIW